jgi:uncharacterized protein YyaL (SSP411 family)
LSYRREIVCGNVSTLISIRLTCRQPKSGFVSALRSTTRRLRRRPVARTRALLKVVHRHFLPNTIVILADANDGQKYLGGTNEAIRAMSLVDGKPAAYVCEDFTCKAPATDPKQLGDLLKL